ncbi:hypothetical protein BpHYR1_046589 [Brachionus plicatilis]|uniref:Uncharacterized protein n=1 Tax=Brachionus plicatilis TaxID=10195 RepID=A0A3M7QB46_BRAPC|nr:hypothetical protein BpHYR1_046589 [Brachionus plicatilis]
MFRVLVNSNQPKRFFLSSLAGLVNQRAYSQLSNQSTPSDIAYVQGQYTENHKIREYFYYLDHQGQLFLDDTKIKNFTSCYKGKYFIFLEKNFLEFFFRKLRKNNSKHYADKFAFVSYCGVERNFLRCDDLPFVITSLDEKNGLIQLNQINSSHWSFKFHPANLFHDPTSGRLYYLFEDQELIRQDFSCEHHPGRATHLNNLPCRVALVKSDISIRLMHKIIDKGEKNFKFEYNSNVYDLNNDPNSKISQLVKQFSNLKQT